MTTIKALEAKHTLFDSVEEILEPRTLSELVQKPVSEVTVRSIGANGGASGSTFSAVETDAGRFFLKHMSIESDFIMMVSDDVRCRSVTLWLYGLLDELRPFVGHKILGCARDGDGWAMLMADLRGALFSEEKPFTAQHRDGFLDALARIHAHFWDDDRLADPALGLTDTAALVKMSSPLIAERYQHRTNSHIPQWIIAGWQVLPELVPTEAFKLIQNLTTYPQPFVDAMARYPATLTHGDYRQANFAYESGRPIVFDWQQSAHMIMTEDLAWLAFTDDVFTTIGVEQANAQYRDRLESALQERFDDEQWQAMIDLGYCSYALRLMPLTAYILSTAESAEVQEWERRRLETKVHYVLRAARLL